MKKLRFLPQLRLLGDASCSIDLSHAFVVPATVGLLVHHLPVRAVLFLALVLAVLVGCASCLLIEKPVAGFLKNRYPHRTKNARAPAS